MVDKLINYMRNTPMYRSMLYFLLTLVALAVGLSIIDTLPYDPLEIVLVSVYLMAVVYAVSWGLGKAFNAKPNPESSLITGLILALIFGPMPLVDNLGTLTFIGLVAAASKYLLVWRRSHIFNPAALAAVATAILLGTGASWWVGSVYLFPLVLIGGLYEAYKTSRFHLAFSFLIAYAVFFLLQSVLDGAGIIDAADSLWTTLRYSPILFFAFVMLIEPLTSPAERNKRIYYGVLTALLVVLLPEILPSTGYTLELSLLAGNLFAVLSGNQGRLLLKLKKKEKLSPNIMNFWFDPSPKRQFKPGQFLHYTLPHRLPDMRGSRRFFSIASSPTENEILLTTKFAEKSSSFKKALKSMKTDDELTALRPEGEFVMPGAPDRQLVFIAGGIGVTPYRSMIKYLLDTNQRRPITLIYAARTEEELVYRDVFDEAQKTLGANIVYVVDEPPKNWKGQKGPLTAELIKNNSPDIEKALFYVSGPEPMVRSLMPELKKIGVPAQNVRHDYFPGYSKQI